MLLLVRFCVVVVVVLDAAAAAAVMTTLVPYRGIGIDDSSFIDYCTVTLAARTSIAVRTRVLLLLLLLLPLLHRAVVSI